MVPGLQVQEAPTTSDGVLSLAHEPVYIRRVSIGGLSVAEQKIIGFPWSPQMVERSRHSVGATIEACRTALRSGVAINLAGGTYHAPAGHGAGFCVFNDAAIADRLMQTEQRLQSVTIVDWDVHQGEGSASILARDDSVFTLSIHGAGNYPFRNEQGDLDAGLPDGAGDAGYLTALRDSLGAMFARFSPQLILFLAGVDPHEGDRLGHLKLTFSGLAAPDRIVLDAAHRKRIPVAIAMVGGYGNDIRDTVTVHLQTIAIAAEYALRWQDNCISSA